LPPNAPWGVPTGGWRTSKARPTYRYGEAPVFPAAYPPAGFERVERRRSYGIYILVGVLVGALVFFYLIMKGFIFVP